MVFFHRVMMTVLRWHQRSVVSSLNRLITACAGRRDCFLSIGTQSLIRFWPWRSSSKQVIFLNELEEVLELLVGSEQIAEVRFTPPPQP